MIDKLECVIELGKPFRPVAADMRDAVTRGSKLIPFKRTPYYNAVVDLRDTDLKVDALWHMQSRHGAHHDKIELLHTGEKVWDDMYTALGSIYAGSPDELPVRRADLCADTDIGIDWYVRSVRCDRKRIERQFGEIQLLDGEGKRVDFMEVAKRKVETVQFGNRPNVTRIYDKVAETADRYEKAKRRMQRETRDNVAEILLNDAGWPGTEDRDLRKGVAKRLRRPVDHMYPFPSFEEWTAQQGRQLWKFQTLTRVERQIHGKIPLLISNVRGLRNNVLDFNPFEQLHFPPVSDLRLDEVSLNEYSPIEWLAISKMWDLLTSGEWSYQQLAKFLNRKGNLKRYEQKYARFFERASAAANEDGRAITEIELYETYRESLKRQLQIAA